LRDTLARRGLCDLDTLSVELQVSSSTIRRDIAQMEREGLVRSTRGGVIWVGDRASAGSRTYAFDQRMNHQSDAKRAIARSARDLVLPGQTILLDGGTTTFHLAQELFGQSLQIVTNSLPIAGLFANDDNIELIMVGGLAYPRYGVVLGSIAETALATINTKTLFLSVAGIHDGLLYNQNLLLVQAERRMMECAQQVVLLADSSKFGQQALACLGALHEVDIVVADAALPPEQQAAVLAAGCKLILA